MKRKRGPEKIFEEIIAENFTNVGKEIVNQVQEAQRVPDRIKPRRNTQDIEEIRKPSSAINAKK